MTKRTATIIAVVVSFIMVMVINVALVNVDLGRYRMPISWGISAVAVATLWYIRSMFIITEHKWHQPVNTLTRTSEYLRKVPGQVSRPVVLLRPFGNDGSATRHPAVSRFINVHVFERTVEQEITIAVKQEFGAETVAIADQRQHMVPQHPTFLASGEEEWRTHIELLLKRALFAVVHIPYSTVVRPSLRWEVFTALCCGLRSRMLVLYPDHWSGEVNTVVPKLRKDLGFIENMDILSDRSIAFILREGRIHRQYVIEQPQSVKWRPRKKNDYYDTPAMLRNFSTDMMRTLRENIDRIPKGRLDAMRNTDLLSFQPNLTNQQMRLIYGSKEPMFDMLGL